MPQGGIRNFLFARVGRVVQPVGKGEQGEGRLGRLGHALHLIALRGLHILRTGCIKGKITPSLPLYEDNGIKYREYRALFYEGH